MSRFKIVSSYLGVVLVLVAVFAFRYYRIGGKTQRELLSLYAQTHLGASLTELHEVFATSQFQHLKLREISSNEVLAIPSSVTRFANDWLLSVTLSNAKITSVRIRMLEGPQYHPESAPPDK